VTRPHVEPADQGEQRVVFDRWINTETVLRIHFQQTNRSIFPAHEGKQGGPEVPRVGIGEAEEDVLRSLRSILAF